MQLEMTGRQRGTLVKVLVLLLADLFGHGNASEALATVARLGWNQASVPQTSTLRVCTPDASLAKVCDGLSNAYAPLPPGLFCLHPSTSPLPVPLLL